MKNLFLTLALCSIISIGHAQSRYFSAIFVVENGESFMAIQNISGTTVYIQAQLINWSTGEDVIVLEGNMAPNQALKFGTNVNWRWEPEEVLLLSSTAGLHVWKVPYTLPSYQWQESVVNPPLVFQGPPLDLGGQGSFQSPQTPSVSPRTPNSGEAARWRQLREDAERRLAEEEKNLQNAIEGEDWAIKHGTGAIMASMRVSTQRQLVNTIRNQVEEYRRKELECQ